MGRRIQNTVKETRRDVWVVVIRNEDLELQYAKPFDIHQDALDFADYKRENGFIADVLESTMTLHRFSEMVQLPLDN